MFELFKKFISKQMLEHEKRIQQIEKLTIVLQKVSGVQQEHLNLISKNQINIMKRLTILESTFIKKLDIDKKIEESRTADIINLDESLRHLNSKVDYFTEEKE